jgi:uncharacterized repeat protein (TIGR01451 family)
MRKKAVSVAACLVLVLTIVLVGPAAAHPVTVGDTSRADWFAKGPPEANIGAIVRDSAGRGEFVWTDAKADQRVIDPNNTGIAREADLTRFNVTADTNNISFLAKVERYSGISNDPALQVMISISSDALAAHTSGEIALPDGVATSVTGAAAWERLVETQFAPGTSATPKVYTGLNTATTAGSAQLVSSSSTVSQGGFAEIEVPWSALGGLPAPGKSLRFTVSTYYADHSAPGDGNASKAIDVIGSNPGGTLADLGADSTIKTFFDLRFSATGEVFAPLLISEFLPDPTAATDPKGEWIEIFNPNSFDVGLNGYKLGDQAYRTGSQGMVQLPNQTLGAGQAIVVANHITSFRKTYPVATVPDAKLIEMNSLTPYTSWASGTISLQNQNSGAAFKESIALLDANDTLVDLVQYAYETPLGPTGLDPDNKPILLSSSAVAANASYDRCPSARDTNDSRLDFFVHTLVSEQTPGQPCASVPGVDLRISKIGPESVEVGPSIQIEYTISFNNAGSSPASNVVITDTLPSALTCISQTATVSSGIIVPSTGCVGGAPLTWNIASLPAGANGTIALMVAIDQGIAQDVLLTNSAGISSNPSEAAATLHNNVAMQTVITAGPPDLTVGTNSTWALATGTGPGREFTYTITYANMGENDANDITITDVLPANVTVVGSSVPTSNNATSGTLTWKVSSLAYRESGTITLVAKIGGTVATGTPLANNLSISGSPADLNGADEAPDAEQATLTVGNRLVYMPMIVT